MDLQVVLFYLSFTVIPTRRVEQNMDTTVK